MFEGGKMFGPAFLSSQCLWLEHAIANNAICNILPSINVA
jgi:hypothetical protein